MSVQWFGTRIWSTYMYIKRICIIYMSFSYTTNDYVFSAGNQTNPLRYDWRHEGNPTHKHALAVTSIKWRHNSWWRHQMETFSALLVICAGNSPVSGEFPAQRSVTRSFDVFFDLRLNKRLSKQSWGRRFETSWRPLWCHCNVYAVPSVAHLELFWIWLICVYACVRVRMCMCPSTRGTTNLFRNVFILFSSVSESVRETMIMPFFDTWPNTV